jgi:hypothetical protein
MITATDWNFTDSDAVTLATFFAGLPPGTRVCIDAYKTSDKWLNVAGAVHYPDTNIVVLELE